MTAAPRDGQARMFAWIADLPAQLRASRGFPGLGEVAPLASPPRHVVFAGMGGSAMAGSLLADGWPGLATPAWVHREPGLPSWADADTLVVACSYSGETAETLDAVAAARARGCRLAAVTSGGRLLAAARGEAGAGGFPAVVLPGGQPPRTALGASLGAQLHLLAALELLPEPGEEIEAACAQFERGELVTMAPAEAPVGEDAARDLAAALAARFPVIFTAGAEAHGAGRRWLAQFNENAKTPGHLAAFPELNHNELVGWNHGPDVADRFALLAIRGVDVDPTTSASVDVVLDLLAEQFAVRCVIHAHGERRLGRILGLIGFGDLLSAHLAVRRGVDPVPIARIDTLKSRLRTTAADADAAPDRRRS